MSEWTIVYDEKERDFQLAENGNATGITILFFGRNDISPLVSEDGHDEILARFEAEVVPLGEKSVKWFKDNLPKDRLCHCGERFRWFRHQCPVDESMRVYGCPKHDDKCGSCMD